MEQRVLSVKLGEKTVVSKPWDFEAMCLVDDAKKKSKGGTLRNGADAVYYLFEGTEATNEVLQKMEPSAFGNLCMKVSGWYSADIVEALKNG